jgi:hypothetical protein
MNHLQIFTDGSVNTQLKVGYGAYLAIANLATPIESLKDTVKVKRFEQTKLDQIGITNVVVDAERSDCFEQ